MAIIAEVISGILTSYATRFTSTQLSQLQECTDASVIIQGARYSGYTLELYVKNRGNINLTFDALITKLDGVVTQPGGPYPTEAGRLTTFQITTDDQIKEATIQAKECSNVQDFISRNFISGL